MGALSYLDSNTGKYKLVPVGGGAGGSNIYSEDEIVIGTWIDGKPLYRKMFYSENSAFATATQFPAPYAEKLVEYSPMYRNDYEDFIPVDAKLYNKGLANAYFQIPSRSYAGGTYWIVKYTKTTD